MLSNSGIIVELKTKKVIIMTQDFSMIEVKRKPYMATGQKINLRDIELYNYPLKLITGLSAFATVAIILIIIGLNHINFRSEISAYVSVDINPSIELAIDNSLKVIKARAINHDSEKIVNSLELEKVQLVDALNIIVNRSEELGYINNESNTLNGKTILVSWALNLNTKDIIKEDTLQNQLVSFCKMSEDKKINTRTFKMNLRDKKSADEYGISLGRYYVLMKAKEKAPHLILEDIKVKGISDLLDSIGEIDLDSESINNTPEKIQPTGTTAANSPIFTDAINSTQPISTKTSPSTATITPTFSPTPTPTSTPTPTPTTPSGISLWYRFDESEIAYDSSGNGNDGTPSDSPLRIEGVVGDGIFLDGVNDYIECGKSTSLQPSSISAALWIQRTDSWNGKERMLFWAKPDGNYLGNGWFITCNDTGEQKYSVLMCVDGLNHFYVKEEPDEFFPVNTWVHLALTFDSETNTYKIYKNGEIQPVSVHGNPDSITPTSDTKYLGYNSPRYNSSFLHGKLDDFRIYSRVLTHDEVKELANVK